MANILGSYVARNSPLGLFALQHIDGVTTKTKRKERRHKVCVVASELWPLAPMAPPTLSNDSLQSAQKVHEDLVFSLEAVLSLWPTVALICFNRCSHLPKKFNLPFAKD